MSAAAAELEPCMPSVGSFMHIYDPTPAPGAKPWYINDHTIVRGPDQQWHLIGITHEEPSFPDDERELAHATSPTLTTATWTRLPSALTVDEGAGETVLWAPFVLPVEGVFHMFYCAGGDPKGIDFQIKHATSTDLKTWQRDPEPLFRDGSFARDPFVIRIGERWVMYYTTARSPQGGKRSSHVVAYRTSDDLLHWSERAFAYVDPGPPGFGAGNTESPYVVARPEGYYLFIGPRDEDYDKTQVFFSRDPLHFESGKPLASFPAHAAEIVQDLDGSQWMTRCGWARGGVYIAPLRWSCGP